MKTLFFVLISLCSLCSFGQSAPDTTGMDGRLRAHVDILTSDSLEGRQIGTEGGLKAVAYIARTFSEQGLSQLGDSYLKTAYDGQLRNAVAMIEGSDLTLRKEVIVIGAHFDHVGRNEDGHICRGANDNASGTAVIMELARMLAKNPMKRSVVLVAFDGEEVGLLGSRQFIKDWNTEQGQLTAMFNFDMAGSLDFRDELTVEGVGTIEGCDSIARTIPIDGYKARIRPYGLTWGNMTDTAAFLEESIPAVYIYTFPRSNIHSPLDAAQKVDYNGLSKVVLYADRFIRSVVGLDRINANKQLIADYKELSNGDEEGTNEIAQLHKEEE